MYTLTHTYDIIAYHISFVSYHVSYVVSSRGTHRTSYHASGCLDAGPHSQTPRPVIVCNTFNCNKPY